LLTVADVGHERPARFGELLDDFRAAGSGPPAGLALFSAIFKT
jgi:hypothetical protein